DAARRTHNGAEDQLRPGPALEGIDTERRAVVAQAVGNEQGHERPGGARHRRDVVVAVALDELRALAAQLARSDEPRRHLPRAGEDALALQRIAKVGECLSVAAEFLALRVATRGIERYGDVVRAARFEDH